VKLGEDVEVFFWMSVFAEDGNPKKTHPQATKPRA